MDEVRQIVHSYKILREKSKYLKNYLEHIDTIYKKSSELLFRAAQLPRDKSWNDNNLINLLEMGERQRVVYDETSSLHNLTIAKDIEDLLIHISKEISYIESDLGDVIKLNNKRMEDIETIKNQHKASWLKGSDPWITDVKLKLAIKNMYQVKEENDLKVQSKITMFEDKLKYTTEMYLTLLKNFVKIQKSLFFNLSETLNFEIKFDEKPERYFDAVCEESREKPKHKIENSYNCIIETISKELSKDNITVYKNIEPVKYGIVKFKKGFRGDWLLMFIVITKTKHLHLFEISLDSSTLKKYNQLILKLKNSLNRGLVSIFEFKKDSITFVDEQNLICLSEEIKSSLETIINRVCLSLDLKNKNIKIEKDKLIITIDEKSQSGFSSLFGMNVIRIRPFTLTSCFEIYFSMTNNTEVHIEESNENDQNTFDVSENKSPLEKTIRVKEDNPWID